MDWRWGLMLLHEGQSGVTYDEEVPCGKTGMPRVEGHHGGCAHTPGHISRLQRHKPTKQKHHLKYRWKEAVGWNVTRIIHAQCAPRKGSDDSQITRSNQWLTNHIWWELQRRHGNDLKMISKYGFTFTITNALNLSVSNHGGLCQELVKKKKKEVIMTGKASEILFIASFLPPRILSHLLIVAQRC